MTPPSQLLSEPQRKGRTFFLCSLALLSFPFLRPILESAVANPPATINQLLALGIGALVVWHGYRGGKISLRVIKGTALLMAILSLTLVVFVATRMALGHPLPAHLSLQVHLETYLTLLGSPFILWTLFLSPSVRAFIAHQQARTLAKEMDKIQRRTEESKRTHALP